MVSRALQLINGVTSITSVSYTHLFTALVQRFISLVSAFSAGTGTFMVEGLQLIVAVLLMILGVTIVVTSGKELISKKAGQQLR